MCSRASILFARAPFFAPTAQRALSHGSARTLARTRPTYFQHKKLQLRTLATMAAVEKPEDVISMDLFALRQFEKNENKVAKIDFDATEFEKRVQQFYAEAKASGKDPLEEGYAPFCKHIYMPNFVDGLTAGYVKITDENRHLIRSDYFARTEGELPVLTRWFPKDKVVAPPATHLDVILYSREQIKKENAATGTKNDATSAWGIISIKAQTVDREILMEPLTAMRNALPLREGGSGVSLDREKYLQSVAFWKDHCRIA